MKTKNLLLTVLACFQFLFAFSQWNAQTSGTSYDLWSIYFTSSNVGYIVGDGGRILKTTDGGTNWNAQSSGSANPLISVYFTDDNNGYAVGYSGTILKTNDAGITWSPKTSGTSNFLRAVYFTDANTGYAVGQSGMILNTTDAGSTWATQTSGTSSDLYSVYFTDANTGYAVGVNGTIRKTTDAGATWTAQTSGTSSHLYSVRFTNTNTGYAVGVNGTILKTTDGGTTWTPQASGTSNILWSVFFIDANTGYAAGFGGTIVKTTNGGANWITQSSGTSTELFCVYMFSASASYVSGLTGVIRKNACAALDAGMTKSDVSCAGGSNGSITSTPFGGVASYTYLWNPGGLTTSAISNLSAGTYSLTVSDNNGCSNAIITDIKQPTVLNASVTPTGISCFGAANGSATVTVTGGTPGYSYTWSNGATTQIITGLAPGTYSVYTTDAGGCMNTKTVSITQPSAISVSISGNTSICAGQSTTLSHSAASGGTSPFTYSWSPGGQTTVSISVSPTSLSIYTVTATDVNSCTTAANKTVNVTSTAATPTVSTNAPLCSGSLLNLNASTIAGATYSWTGPNSFSSTAQNANIGTVATNAAGTYTVTASVAGCATGAAATLTVAVNQTPAAPSGGSNSTVNSGQTLSLTASTIAGAGYDWSGPNSFVSAVQNPTISNVTIANSGNYSVKTVKNGCNSTNVNVPVVVNNTNPVSLSFTVTPASCSSTDGTATATLSGGVGPYTYWWSSSAGNQTTQTATGLAAGIYSATVSDATFSQATANVTVNNAGISVSAGSNTTICSGQSATLNATPGGGTPSYIFSWAPNDGSLDNVNISNPVATSLAPTTDYTVTVTDAVGCIALSTVKVTRTSSAIGFGAGSNTPVCSGQTLNFSADIIADATYSWTGPNAYSASGPSPSIASVTTAEAGTYTVTVMQYGCLVISGGINPVVVNPLPASPTASSNSPVNAGQDLSLTASTIAGAAYNWNGPNSFSSSSQNPNLAGVTTAAAGTYSVSAKVNGCSGPAGTTSVAISAPSLSVTVTSTTITCNGGADGSATASAAGGAAPYTYTWSTSPVQSAAAATGLTAGSYTVTLKDALATIITTTVNITEPAALSVSISGNTTICSGESSTLTSSVSNGVIPYSYSWNTGETTTAVTFSPTANTTYTVSVTDANTCTNTATVSVTANSIPVVSVSGNTTICSGTSTSLTAAGGATYEWSTAGTTTSITVSPSATTAYSVIGTNVSGCADTAFVSVTVNSLPAAAFSTTTVCLGNSTVFADMSTGGVTQWSWDFGDASASTQQNPSHVYSAAGSYTASLIATNASGCSDTALVSVDVNTIPAVSVSGITTICIGDSTLLTAAGAAVYSWSTGATTANITVSPTSATTYSVIGTNAAGCADTAISSVTINTLPVISVAGITTVCSGSSSILTASGGVTYNWSTGETTAVITVSPPANTTFTVFGTNAAGCSDSATITVGGLLPIPITATTTPTSCGNKAGTAVVSISGPGAVPPFSILWNTGDTGLTINSLDAGIYRANVTDGNGCFSFADALVTSTNGPVLTTNSVTDVTCQALSTGAIDMNITGGSTPYTFFWSNGTTTEDISNVSYGPYEIVVTDASGCSVTKSIFVNEPAPLSIASSVINSSCTALNGSAAVAVNGGTVPYTYVWLSGATTSAIAGIGAGLYQVSVTDSLGCFDSLLVAVLDSTGPVVVVDTVAAADCGSAGFIMIVPQDSLSIASYSWSTGSTTQNLNNAVPGNYGLVITDTSGCKSTLVVPVVPVLPPLKPICVVTVDTVSTMNIVVWEKPVSTIIAGFNIYRESSQNGVYQLIAYQPYNVLSTYYDSVSNPADKWAKYRISMKDICGKEGPLSPEHKTIHLSTQSATTDSTFLIWDAYVGYAFSYYHIFRKDSATASWYLIDSVPAVQTTYLDTTFPFTGDTIYYHIDVSHGGGDCVASIKNPLPEAATVKSSKSNSSDRATMPALSVAEVSDHTWMSVYPNPSSGIFTVSSSRYAIADIHIYNLLGEIIYSKTVNAKKADITIPAGAGVYQLQIKTTSGTVNRKIVISR